MSHYLITGGAGFIGTNLAKELIRQGHKVRVIDNYSAGRFPERVIGGVEYIEGDIRNRADLDKVMKDIDGVFHTAAIPRVPFSVDHPDISNEANITGTLNVLLAARDAKVKRVIFSGSSSIYGGNKGVVALNEETQAEPKSPYALQKLTGQWYCRLFAELYGLETVTLVYFNIYGPYLNPEGAYALVIGIFIRQSKANQPLTICGDGEYYRDFTHVHDAVDANIRAMTSEKVGNGEVINIGNSRPFSINQLAELFGRPTVRVADRPGDVRYSKADITKAKNLLGWQPTIPLEEGIATLKKEWGIE